MGPHQLDPCTDPNKMKFYWWLFALAVLALVAADEDTSLESAEEGADGGDIMASDTGAPTSIQGRTRSQKQGGNKQSRLFGGLGVNPGFGGFNPGFGGFNNGFGFAPVAPPSSCRYWCRTPEGQAYCCENVNQPQSAAGVVKPGRCPPVRPVCPTRSFQPPFTCSNDGACGGFDKCCFDRCLGEHTCKAPLGYLGIGR